MLTHIIEIKEDIAAIKQHGKDQNGRVFKLDKQLTEGCPLKHKELEENIDKREEAMDKRVKKIELNMAKWAGAYTVLNGIIMFLITKWEVVKQLFGG